MIEYTIRLSFNLGTAVDRVRQIEDSVNSILSTFGTDERLAIRSNGLSIKLQCDRELKTKERIMLKNVLTESFNERFPSWNFSVDSIRRKSCNQSHSKSL